MPLEYKYAILNSRRILIIGDARTQIRLPYKVTSICTLNKSCKGCKQSTFACVISIFLENSIKHVKMLFLRGFMPIRKFQSSILFSH